MKNRRIQKIILIILVFCLSFGLVACKDRDEGKLGKEGLVLALTGESFSESYIRHLSPLYAETPTDRALSALTAPKLMRYDKEEGWVSVLGSIEVQERDGVTVAKVKLNTGLGFPTGGRVSIKDYISTIKRVLNVSYDGIYKDFYKNPIVGLVPYRYNCDGLTLKDVPDFDAETEKLFENLDRNTYKKMLLETSLAGLFRESAEELAPSGQSFKEWIKKETQNAEAQSDAFFEGPDAKERVLEELCTLYSRMPKDEWILKELKESEKMLLELRFKEECEKKGTDTFEIAGIRNSFNNNLSCQITFEKRIADENEVIKMLNLPIVAGGSNSQTEKAVGAGDYYINGFSKGKSGYMIELKNSKEERLSILTMQEQDVYATMHLGQISAAVLSEMPGEAEQKELKNKYLVEFTKIDGAPIVYNPEKVTLKELGPFKNLFVTRLPTY